jgi:transglutaminase-like putative cysteine protease
VVPDHLRHRGSGSGRRRGHHVLRRARGGRAAAGRPAPTVDAPSDDPAIVARAQALGNDPVRIYNFVHDTIATELYLGSKKGALGTLREGAGNDADQASLLIALLRAAASTPSTRSATWC